MQLKSWLYPGPDLHIRQRGAVMLRHLASARGLRALDAGCGNSYFSFLGAAQGCDVVGVSVDEASIHRCEEFRDLLAVPRERVQFRAMNLYDLGSMPETFDRIVGVETLEHILDDEKVLRSFWDRLKPGGRVIIGVPNLDGPDFYGEVISTGEDGGHVRKGYTHAQLEGMLERIGFTSIARDIYGGGWTRRAIARHRRWNTAVSAFGAWAAPALGVFAFLALRPLAMLERFSRAEPLSILVVASRP